MKLSILDQSPVAEGATASIALCNSVQLAKVADRLGFHRYWVSEHHGVDTLACSAPEILIARIAAETQRLRIGSGGVLLNNHPPLKVAENFRMLQALFPGRIDLGIGRSAGGAPGGSSASCANPQQNFDAHLKELRALVQTAGSDGHAGSYITPQCAGAPELWLLGSGPASADLAARLSMPYAFAHFLRPEVTREAIQRYSAAFCSSPELASPKALVAVGVVCAASNQEASELALSAYAVRQRMRQDLSGGVPTVENARREIPTLPEATESGWPWYFTSTPAVVREQLEALARTLHIDELMVITTVHSHAARVRSYELLAQAFDLSAQAC